MAYAADLEDWVSIVVKLYKTIRRSRRVATAYPIPTSTPFAENSTAPTSSTKNSLPTFGKKTTVTTPSLTNPTSRKGWKKESSQRDSLLANKILVSGDFGHGKLSNAVECTAEYAVNHQAPQTLRQPLPAGSKAGAMSRDLDV
ncbi:hypothetical protein E4U60_004018 [Claviceps pazoutovae]|uniref:Uncharacterized protein n=1 Tax=Claviceps pazoutovae TaxID=1649127 RepID=A0A9P7M9E9_9HYPO|nr:hypothetical protein E4U60_004018 [Claviceps pazoutovae]